MILPFPPLSCHLLPLTRRILLKTLHTRVKMDKKPAVVFLEDLETPKAATKENVSVDASKENATTDTEDSGETKGTPTKASDKKTATGATKRQRAITDMFSKAPSASSSSAPATKKARTLTANPSLNSIPFSLTEYQDSMNDDEKKYLALECETMGKSW